MIEEPSYYPNLTGYENLVVFQQMIGFDKNNIEPTLKLVGLWNKELKRKCVKSYSLGMKQRLALAFALVKKPQILLLDEPTNGLDPSGIHEIRALILQLAKQHGITIFISSHILSEIEQIADHVAIINHGKIIYEGSLNKIKSNQWIEIEGNFTNTVQQCFTSFPNIKILSLSNHLITINSIDNQVLTVLITQLIQHKNEIYRIERKQENLEHIFLKMTEGALQ